MVKKLVVVAVLVLGSGWVAWARWLKPERRACAKLASLCSDENRDVSQCVDDLEKLDKKLGSAVSRRLESCVGEASSCPEAAGCLVGAGLEGVGDAANQFMKGLGRSLSTK